MDHLKSENSNLQALIEDLAAELGRSVVINDPLVHVLHTSRHYGDEDPLRVRAVLQHDAGAAASRYILDQGVSRWSGAGMLVGSDELGMRPRLCVPLRDRGELLGLLMVIDADHTLTPSETARIEHVSRAATALLAHEHVGGDADRRQRDEAVRLLVGDDPVARDRVLRTTLARAATAFRHGATCLAICLEGAGLDPAQAGSALRGVLDSVGRHGRDRVLTSGGDLDGVVIVAESRLPGLATEVASRVLEGLDRLLPRPGLAAIGLGDTVEGLAFAHRSRFHARIAARCSSRRPAGGRVTAWDELGAVMPLLTLAEVGLDAQAIPPEVEVLLAHDKGARLVETAMVFLDNAGSIPRTAALLHLHRSTLYYRFNQIRDITGLDLDDGRDRTRLHIGLMLADLVPAGPFRTDSWP